MSENGGQSDRRLILEIVKLALVAAASWGATDHYKGKEVARKDGALDTCRGVIYTGQSDAYYQGAGEQLDLEATQRYAEQGPEGGTAAEEVPAP